MDAALQVAPSFADDRAVLGITVRLTLGPRTMRAEHLAPLRAAGLTDREIHDVVQVVCCFSYMNRLADGLGVTADPAAGSWDFARRLMGEERVQAHLAWAAERAG